MKKLFAKSAVAVSACAALMSGPIQAEVLDIHLSIPKDLVFLSDSTKLMDKTLREMSGGEMGFNLYGAGELVGAFEVFDAVAWSSSGRSDWCDSFWSGPGCFCFLAALGWWSRNHPARI